MTAPSIDLPTGRRSRFIGIGFICIAVACFSVLDTTAKHLTGEVPILQLVWARYLFHFLLSLLVMNPLVTPGVLPARRPGLQILRGGLLVAVTVSNFFALKYLQLDQTVSIGFSAPFLVAVLAGPLLGEWVDRQRLTAVAIGFAGVLFVVQPSLHLHPAVFVSLFSAACNAFYSLSTRVLAAYDSSKTTLFFTGLVGMAVTSPFVGLVWTWPSGWDWALMAIVGALGMLGHFMLILAHHHAPASVIAPFNYSQLVWMVLLGYFVFGNVPTSTTLVGAVIMIGAGVYLIDRERRMNLPSSVDTEVT